MLQVSVMTENQTVHMREYDRDGRLMPTARACTVQRGRRGPTLLSCAKQALRWQMATPLCWMLRFYKRSTVRELLELLPGMEPA